MTSVQKFTLDNGVRVLIDPDDHVRSAAVGLWCRTGSRHEEPREAGITHVIEHMLFKGTERRTAKQIVEEIEGRGGMINAFTDKEQTCYYCRVLSDEVERSIDVLADMLACSKFDPDELEREKSVILEEIKRSQDEPSDLVHDVHFQQRWKDHPLGRPVIGTSESVRSFDREDLLSYMDRRYLGENLLLAVAGCADVDRVVRVAEDLLGAVEPGSNDAPLARPAGLAGRHELGKDVEQVHFCIGTDACSIYDDDYHATVVLDGILGGGMSSRLFQEIREKRGLAYSIGSYYLSYSAGGAFTVYGGTSPATWEQVQTLVAEELERVGREEVPDEELSRVKRSIAGNMVLALEGMGARMMRMARNEIAHQRSIPVEETLAKIDAVTAAQVSELARKMFDGSLVSITAIGPEGGF